MAALCILQGGTMKLIIAEKPSVALFIAKVVGASSRKDGYIQGNGYMVSWCVGHLIQMASPDKYDEKYAKWNLDDLPILPKDFKYEVSKNTKKQYGVLKKLLHLKEVDTVINACDAGREGELIFRLVYEEAKCKKPIKRLWISSMEDEAIRKGIESLASGKDFENLFESAKSRAIADWLVGMNLSRLYSCLYNQNYSVGRVQTPTLSMIAERDSEISSFIKEPYYVVEIVTDEFSLSTDRIDSKEIAEQLSNLVPEELIVTEVINKDKITKPEPLFDLTALQRAANRYFGFSAKQTLDYLQSLYEKKLVTYPRTDSRYLTDDMKDTVSEMLNTLGGGFERDAKNLDSIFKNEKVSDHHAILPTLGAMKSGPGALSSSEQKLYDLIRAKLLMCASSNLIESTTKVMAEFDGFIFSASGKTVLEEGFVEFMKPFLNNTKRETILPKLSEGNALSISGSIVRQKFTQPPKHFTEETLLKAMELAGAEDIEKGIEVERKGLGTPATRAGVIENLIYKGFIERDKKNLLATHKGISLITIVSEEFRSPKTTAEWEMKLSKIADGKESAKDFLKDIERDISNLVHQYQK